MKTCPKCLEAVEDNATMCPHCYEILSVEKTSSTPGPRPVPRITPHKTHVSLSKNAKKLYSYYDLCLILTKIVMWLTVIGMVIAAIVCFATEEDILIGVGVGMIIGGVLAFLLFTLCCKIIEWHKEFFADYITLERKTNK